MFPIPKEWKFKGLHRLKISKTSGADAVVQIRASDDKELLSSPTRFRLLLLCTLYITGTATFSSVVTVYLFPRFYVELSNYYNYLAKRTATAATRLNMPIGANIISDEFQGYPIPWFPDEEFIVNATAGGAGKTVTLDLHLEWLEWETKLLEE